MSAGCMQLLCWCYRRTAPGWRPPALNGGAGIASSPRGAHVHDKEPTPTSQLRRGYLKAPPHKPAWQELSETMLQCHLLKVSYGGVQISLPFVRHVHPQPGCRDSTSKAQLIACSNQSKCSQPSEQSRRVQKGTLWANVHQKYTHCNQYRWFVCNWQSPCPTIPPTDTCCTLQQIPTYVFKQCHEFFRHSTCVWQHNLSSCVKVH